MKTVLVPGIGWPSKDAKVSGKKRYEEIFEKRSAKEIEIQADLNFEAWVQKQKKIHNFDFLKDKK